MGDFFLKAKAFDFDSTPTALLFPISDLGINESMYNLCSDGNAA